ncbi:uncharacterized protein LOC124439027 [Xenia sp. Carnegie-2017]|uniref:uncharacterized protein LOC124439027 n=1 Tax=Xenia sp. Carnegie-2017 TaxID=2897299 RepID=UPI001F03F258|nr:uncharacterized protein LOC124439027 [Xenia sp. Carnegie-2017]
MQKGKTSSFSPGTPKAVSYFNHFPANFLKPYGLADDVPSQDVIMRSTKPIQTKPTKDNVIALLKFLYKEDAELDKIVDSMFKYGGALFAMSCNIIVARTLIRNHESYAGLVAAENQSDADVKRKKDIKEMKSSSQKTL